MTKKKPSTLRDVGEFAFIQTYLKKYFSLKNANLSLGIGDDAALLTLKKDQTWCVSKDLLVEGSHFLRQQPNRPYLLGRKSLAVNLSDLAAMGARPQIFFLGLGLPSTTKLKELKEFLQGMAACAREYSVTLAGGDMVRAKAWTISVTVLGSCEQAPILRSGAKAGDELWVTGSLGASHLGLQAVLQVKKLSKISTFCVQKHLNPQPRVAWGQALAKSGLVTSMLDISDGLYSDTLRILEASQVGCRIRLADIPQVKNYAKMIGGFRLSPLQSLVNSGEEYELLFTVRKPRAFRQWLAASNVVASPIGEITPRKRKVEFIDARGGVQQLKAVTHHF